MKATMEQQLESSIPDMCDLPWTQVIQAIQPGDNALGQLLKSWRTLYGLTDANHDGTIAEQVSAFNNYI